MGLSIDPLAPLPGVGWLGDARGCCVVSQQGLKDAAILGSLSLQGHLALSKQRVPFYRPILYLLESKIKYKLFAKHQLNEQVRESFPIPGEQLVWDQAAGPLLWD